MRAPCIIRLQWLLFCDSKFETLISENFQRGLFLTFGSAPLRSLVCSSGAGGRRRSVVVPIFADESWSVRLRGRPAGDARPGVGHMVPAGWKTAKFHSRVSPGGSGSEPQKTNPFHFQIGKNGIGENAC